MKKDKRDSMIEKGYYLPIIFSILMLILLCALNFKAQTPEQVFNECIKQGIQHPEIVAKQAMLETGNFECSNCSFDHNNIFGFRWKGKYLEFDSWQESVAYYKKWQQKWFKGEKQYFDFLECIYVHSDGRCQRYAESKDYIYKLKQIQKETDPADTIKAIIHDKGFKISSMKRSFYKKQFAPAGLTRLIVRIKGNRKLYEGAEWILISDDAEKNQESKNEIVKRLFDKFINLKTKSHD